MPTPRRTAVRSARWNNIIAPLALALLASCATQIGGDAAVEAGAGPRSCGGMMCTADQICCYASGSCVDRAAGAAACGSSTSDAAVFDATTVSDATVFDATAASDATGVPDAVSWSSPAPPGSTPCNSDLDCDSNSYCTGNYCIGSGWCAPKDNCGFCRVSQDGSDPPLGTACQLCGCDGVTYASIQAACHAGVRTTGYGACGTAPTPSPTDAGNPEMRPRIPCGNDAQCPQGMTCCAGYGVCVDPSCPYCCQPPPPGTEFPCGDDRDCYPSEYCAGTGCGTPGGCARIGSPGSCEGQLSPVCGCDGQSYTNECWARVAGTRIASTGPCPDAGM